MIAGREYCMALLSDGTVWAWGRNTYGQLGEGTRKNRNKPVQVKDLSDITAIYGGAEHSLAVKADGTVWAWGRNQVGQLGNGTNTDSAIPTQVKFSQNGVSDADGVATFTIKGNNFHLISEFVSEISIFGFKTLRVLLFRYSILVAATPH